MDRKRIMSMWLLYRRRCRRFQKRRRYWVHPIVLRRTSVGAFYTLFQDLREHEEKFFNYFRMSISSFDELHSRLKDTLQLKNTVMRDCIQPIQMLVVAIRYLASGCTFTELHYSYRLGISTISKIVKDVCIAIWNVMRWECILAPTKQKWEEISLHFEKRANFPHCLGAVDGKHIRMVNPIGSMYHNYKGYASVVLMAVADSDYRFVYVDIGSYGKDCDSKVFKISSLWKSIEKKEQDLPSAQYLPEMPTIKVPYFFVGDEAFALHQHLLRPFGGHNLTVSKRIFNYRLCRARRYVECTFGILTNKWRIFHRAINLKPDYAVDIIKACVVLHNFVRDRDGYIVEDTFTIKGLEDLPREPTVRGGTTANHNRNTLAEYFLTEAGSVSWQHLKI